MGGKIYLLGDTVNVYRNELKYFINEMDYINLSKVFKTALEKDVYDVNNEGYWIRSLYFDTLQNKDYYEKIIGSKDRKKIRIRMYDVDSDKVKLEIKNRYDNYMLKETINITREDAIDIMKGNLDVLLKYNNKLANKIYYIMHNKLYIPSIIVDYNREAYTCPINSIRITFDKNLRASKNIYSLFDKNINTVKVFNEPKIILEVKYNNMLPKWIREILSIYNAERSSISKYCLSREILY